MNQYHNRRILIMSDVTAPGGVSVYLSQLSYAARTSHWQFTILLDNGSGSDPVERFLLQCGEPVWRAPIRRDRQTDHEIEHLFSKILDRLCPDVVHAVLGSPRSLLVPREVCLARGIPLIMTEQYVAPDLDISKDIRTRICRIYAQAAHVIWVCAENERLVREHFGFATDRGVVIPNSPYWIDVKPRRQRESREILTVARLSHQKGIDILIQAARVLRTEGVKISIAGDGEQLGQLQTLALKLGFHEDQIRFLGWREDVTELLATHDLFVLPSRFEGQPFALLEALSMGIPCIATAVSGIPEALDYGCFGNLVPPEDPYALALAIDCFFDDPTILWLKVDAATKHLRQHFNLKLNLQKVVKLWSEALLNI